jgi:hypothetical protein
MKFELVMVFLSIVATGCVAYVSYVISQSVLEMNNSLLKITKNLKSVDELVIQMHEIFTTSCPLFIEKPTQKNRILCHSDHSAANRERQQLQP